MVTETFKQCERRTTLRNRNGLTLLAFALILGAFTVTPAKDLSRHPGISARTGNQIYRDHSQAVAERNPERDRYALATERAFREYGSRTARAGRGGDRELRTGVLYDRIAAANRPGRNLLTSPRMMERDEVRS